MDKKDYLILAIFLMVSLFVFLQDLSIHGIEYRDDEIFYVESTREMVSQKNWFSPTYFGENRFQKPILFYWLIMLSYKIFGVNWFAARMVSVIAATLTVGISWLLARDLFNRTIASLSSIILITLPLFFRHAKDAVPDMTLNFFIVSAIFCAVRFIKNPDLKVYQYAFFVVCGLGFMIKGFAAVVIPFLVLMLYAFPRGIKTISKMNFALGFLILGIIVLPWFIYMTKIHGSSYAQYILITETQNRLMIHGQPNYFLAFVKNFSNNAVFYLGVLLSYFLPWSVFFVFALPAVMIKVLKANESTDALGLILIWFFVVFIFFSMIHVRINHYLLVLTTPAAILVAFFFVQPVKEDSGWAGLESFFKRYVVLLILGISIFAFSFIKVFLTKASPVWIPFYSMLLFISGVIIYKSRQIQTASLCLGLFLLFVFSQSSLLGKAGITFHSSLQRFAETIQEQLSQEAVIGVGSHDIHEKEFQVYFTREVEKAATSNENETRWRMSKLFANRQVFCLMTRWDYENTFQHDLKNQSKIIQEEYMFRKRLNIDRGFFIAVTRLNQERVRDYLMEKIVLVYKG